MNPLPSWFMRLRARDLAGDGVTFLSVVLLATVYLWSAPSLLHHHWDSLDYAHACEAGAPHWIRGNHPVGHVLLCGGYRVAAALDPDARAVAVMSAANAWIAATTIVVFGWLLRLLRIRTRLVVAWCALLAACHGFWLYAGTADIYGLSLLAMLVAWGAMISAAEQPGRRRWCIAGVAVGLAVLVHQFNGPLLLAAFAGLVVRTGPDARRVSIRGTLALGATAGALVLSGYLALGAWAVGGNLDAIGRWIVGYGADPTYGRSFHALGQLHAIGTAAETLLRSPRTAGFEVARVLMLEAMAAVFVIGLLATPLATGRLRRAAPSALMQLLVGAPLIWWWAPDHMGKWWLLMLPAFVVIQATGVEVLRERMAIPATENSRRVLSALDAIVIGLAVLCVVFTGLLTVRTMRPPDAEFERAMALWQAHTRPDDVVFESDLTAHLLFWTGRPRAQVLSRLLRDGRNGGDPLARVRAVIDDALREGRTVWYADGMEAGLPNAGLRLSGVKRDEIRAFFAAYQRSGPVFSYRPREGQPERRVYRVSARSLIARAAVRGTVIHRHMPVDDSDATEFHVYCPYCGEDLEISLEPELLGTLVMDCEVCCRPWQVHITRDSQYRSVEVTRGDGSE